RLLQRDAVGARELVEARDVDRVGEVVRVARALGQEEQIHAAVETAVGDRLRGELEVAADEVGRVRGGVAGGGEHDGEEGGTPGFTSFRELMDGERAVGQALVEGRRPNGRTGRLGSRHVLYYDRVRERATIDVAHVVERDATQQGALGV